jgi:hypothetical protein
MFPFTYNAPIGSLLTLISVFLYITDCLSHTAYSSTLKLEAAGSLKILVPTYQGAWYHPLPASNLQVHYNSHSSVARFEKAVILSAGACFQCNTWR